MHKTVSVLLLFLAIQISAQTSKNDVLGRWISSDKSVAVNVYKEGNNFKAKVIWFDERLGSGTPMNTRKDTHNPEEDLRNRKIIGMDVLENLNYNSENQRWENGKIYDASSGRTWDTFAEIQKNGKLYVRGFWKFSWIGKTLYFSRF
ncbi:DUF2147 domain-containing protein [Chryseobacterium sp.]|uniref:DUF2147 domain-containing protein n=1 Tax=Chryseobacterium sp. TaxID=1871047 RepID=UPI0011CA23A7|nr:DUF2147 domain-containing protein [Chryseobacterium sp.]TXF74833.1 DUF2147 domain-containing protein [Chryseobacterium sp.]